jgi:hypothetical protein
MVEKEHNLDSHKSQIIMFTKLESGKNNQAFISRPNPAKIISREIFSTMALVQESILMMVLVVVAKWHIT